jgi:hypothetical protein
LRMSGGMNLATKPDDQPHDDYERQSGRQLLHRDPAFVAVIFLNNKTERVDIIFESIVNLDPSLIR